MPTVYSIIVKAWNNLAFQAESPTSYAAACKLACELSTRCPGVAFSVFYGADEQSVWLNGN